MKLKNAVVFQNSHVVRCLNDVNGKKKVAILHLEENEWQILYMYSGNILVEGNILIYDNEKFYLELKEINTEPEICYFAEFYFAEIAERKEEKIYQKEFLTFPEVVAHFWNRKKEKIRLVLLQTAVSTEMRKQMVPNFMRNLTVIAVDANEYGFWDEKGRFWKIMKKRNAINPFF